MIRFGKIPVNTGVAVGADVFDEMVRGGISVGYSSSIKLVGDVCPASLPVWPVDSGVDSSVCKAEGARYQKGS